jgi:lysophospholipase L1-like esterase
VQLDDARLSWVAPQPPEFEPDGVRLLRFPRAVSAQLAGQIGPLANLRSSPGCGVRLATDSPWLDLRLVRLRHHQPFPASVALDVEHADGVRTVHGPDLREHQGDVVIRLPTGLERGSAPLPIALWLPLISTCSIASLDVADGSQVLAAPAPSPRWLAIGDSLTQGFSVQSPADGWVHRLSRRLSLPSWNLGVGGIKIEPEAFRWALESRVWEVVTIGLGSNHAWRQSDADTAADAARVLARIAVQGPHRRIIWILPPWKPCESGKGPADFQGVPLGADTGARVRQVRESLRHALAEFAPRLELAEGHVPEDVRLLPDGLHPVAHGSAIIAERIGAVLNPSTTTH